MFLCLWLTTKLVFVAKTSGKKNKPDNLLEILFMNMSLSEQGQKSRRGLSTSGGC